MNVYRCAHCGTLHVQRVRICTFCATAMPIGDHAPPPTVSGSPMDALDAGLLRVRELVRDPAVQAFRQQLRAAAAKVGSQVATTASKWMPVLRQLARTSLHRARKIWLRAATRARHVR